MGKERSARAPRAVVKKARRPYVSGMKLRFNGARTVMVIASLVLPAACGGSKQPSKGAESAQAERDPDVPATLEAFKAKDPSLAERIEKSAGYILIPSVGVGAFIVGGGHGKGEAFENGTYVGTVTVSEVSVGAQVGGQTYSELVLFDTARDFERLKRGSYAVNAEVTAVIVEKGAARGTPFVDGTMVFVMPQQGLMAAAAVAGQKISFQAAQ